MTKTDAELKEILKNIPREYLRAELRRRGAMEEAAYRLEQAKQDFHQAKKDLEELEETLETDGYTHFHQVLENAKKSPSDQ